MTSPADVAFFFDFISPYSYLALAQARKFERDNGVRFQPTPIVYAKLLEATGLVGPAQVEVKRRYTFADILRCAHRQGVPLIGPPAHPFRSLEALRAVTLHREHPRVLDLAVALSAACWAERRDLTDVAVIADVTAKAGFDASDFAERIAAQDVKDALAAATAEAIARGVFGVPTFVADGEMFWGHDRMTFLADYVAGRLPAASELRAPRP